MRRLLTICLGLCLCLSLRGTAQPNVTSYARMTAQLHADAARSPWLRVISVGKSAQGKRDLWLARLADPAADPAQTIRILVLCRQHGDEPASTESILGLIHRLAGGSDPSLRASLAHVTLYLVPMVNPDGAEAGTRVNGAGADLNRDWGIFHQPETRAVARAAHLLRPRLVVDAHNWDGGDEYNADCLEVPRETATELGRTSHILQQLAVQDLSISGYSVHPTAWGADTDPRLAHRWFARQNILSALVETHSGSPADLADFQRRQGLYAALIHSIARRYAADTTQKTQIDALEGNSVGAADDAALFPALPKAASRPRFSSPRGRSFAWLWALGVYGLTLWGAGLKKPQFAASDFSSRSGRRRGKHTKNYHRLKMRCQKAEALPALARLPFRFRHRKPRLTGPPPFSGYYSFARKREGTEIKARSGQRKAVSIPPR